MSSSKQEIAALIIDFLTCTADNNEISEDYVDSVNVAIDCIAEAFEVDKQSAEQIVQGTFGGKKIEDFITKEPKSETVKVNIPVEDADTKAKAEALKLEGNKAMAAKDYTLAIAKYTEAIKVLPSNAVYYSNRAAAHSSMKNYDAAVKDAQSAISVDPAYSKGYSRLGFAQYALGNASEALDAYKEVLDIEGESATDAMRRDYETAKKKVEQSLNLEKSTLVSNEAEEKAAADAAGSTGGLPDFSSLLGGGLGGLLNNPQVMQAAQSLMQNPNALNDMMSNPALKQMADKFSSGGGAPNMSDLMKDPALMDMAKNMFGGGPKN
ncbi:LAMI_0B07888g1_1 [Lachancea mirantina]|uniref:LAMI_0B07888g1_1 n=1 Tax=Lachancea mirantina TaxID=1230905 RepID=A0A1G4IXN5_9SACH|nr:LAMI_0B07888g1_1 [Lachancea mirantina]